MLNENLIELARRFFKGISTEEEKQRLNQWYDNWEDDIETVYTSNEDTEESVRMRIFSKIIAKINNEKIAARIRKKRNLYRIAAAASVVVLFSITAYLMILNSKEKQQLIKNDIQNDILAPTDNKATLTLADGRKIQIDSIQSGSLANQFNVNVVKTIEGKIEYQSNGTSQNNLVYNTLDNPKGSKVQVITLSDGSKVWLNSETSLRFPVYFKGNQRNVELTGEAYFEVAKNNQLPFKVNIAGVGEVEVLGTHFNINAYYKEKLINTTLLEGKVRLRQIISQQSAILSPGQQGTLNINGQIDINKEIDIDEVMAWKNNIFNFNSQDIESIMIQVGRWYDVDVVFEGKISKKTYSGIFNRSSNISQVMKILETGGIKYKIDGKKIIILNNHPM